MHVLEKHFGDDFFIDLEKIIGLKVLKISYKTFDVSVNNETIRFMVYENRNVIVATFPFSCTIIKRKRIMEGRRYREYRKFYACYDIRTRYINFIKEKIDSFINGLKKSNIEVYLENN